MDSNARTHLDSPVSVWLTRRTAAARLRFARYVAVASALLCVGTGHASDVPAGNRTTSVDDSIAAAKQELQLLQSAASLQGADVTTSGSTPTIALPDFHSAAEAAPVSAKPATKPDAMDERSKNWLVDAMLEPKQDLSKLTPMERALRERASGNQSDARRDAVSRSQEAGPSRDSPSEASDQAKREDAKGLAAFNPLSRYMADWVAPKDYALLKTAVTDADTSSLPTVPGAASVSQAAPDVAAIAGLTDARPAPAAAAPALQSPADNPFLAALNEPAPAPVDLTVAPAPTPAPLPEVAPPPPPPAEKSTIPDFAKRGEDDKYLKPLKRF